jgi:uncharacterized protein involved in outer membrane biogenesis
VLLLAVVLVIGLLLLKDNLARSFAEQRIHRETGFDVKIGKLELGLLTPKVTIENLVLYNPPEFGGSKLIDAPEVHFEYNPKELALRRVHLNFLRLRVNELNIVQSKDRTNIVELLHGSRAGSAKGVGSEKPSGCSFTGIDLMNLSVGKVRYLHLQRPKRNQEIQLALENHLVHNIRSEEDFTNVLLKLLFRAGITIYVD